jgi:hypothetical protein
MKLIQAAVAAAIALACSSGALAQSKATQMSDSQMANWVAGTRAADVYKPDNTTTFIWNTGEASRYNDRGRALTTVNQCGGQGLILC